MLGFDVPDLQMQMMLEMRRSGVSRLSSDVRRVSWLAGCRDGRRLYLRSVKEAMDTLVLLDLLDLRIWRLLRG